MKRKIIILFLIVVTVIVIIFVYKKAGAFVPFGGEILFVQRCQCPIPGFLIQVGPPVGGSFLYTPTTTLFPNGNIITPGTWLLGLHTGTPVGCGNYDKGYCAAQVPAQGIMYMVGTS